MTDAAAPTPPPRVRRSLPRTLATLLLLIFLTSLIVAYAVVTDSRRVRAYSETFLSDMTGGAVTIGKAKLSIFEGLQLSDVKVYAGDGEGNQSLLFEARSISAGYNPKALLAGRIEATRVLALEPRVNLVEYVDQNEWNFQRVRRPTTTAPSTKPATHRPAVRLPEIVLRNARIQYTQVSGGRASAVGSLSMEGQLVPDPSGVYRFRLQTRGDATGAYPVAEGWVAPAGPQLGVVLRDVDFVDEIKTTLPAVVRRFWEEHRLSGRITETRISYFRKNDGKPGFRVETNLDGVTLSLLPDKWLTDKEQTRIRRWDAMASLLASPAAGKSAAAGWLRGTMSPIPIEMTEVDGRFVFTDEKITIPQLTARVGENRIRLRGEVEGYDTRAAGWTRIETLRDAPLVIPARPTGLATMPWAVQQIYYRFLPQGKLDAWTELTRKKGGDLTVRGGLKLRDASMQYAGLPYPVRDGSGTFRFSTDPATGTDRLEIIDLTGRGIAGGPNADTRLHVSGVISPLDEAARAALTIEAKHVRNEPALLAALPPETQKAINKLHAPGRPLEFVADIRCDVDSPNGIDRPWRSATRVRARNVSGAVAEFGVPFAGVSSDMTFHDHLVEIASIDLPWGGGSLGASGVVRLTPGATTGDAPVAWPDLTFVARDVGLDDDLLALFGGRSGIDKRLSIQGRLDGTGRLKRREDKTLDVGADVRVSRGTVRLLSTDLELTDLAMDAWLDDDALSIKRLVARRGDATLEGRAKVGRAGREATYDVAASVQNLMVDAPLLSALPPSIRQAVLALKPSGTLDAALTYTGNATTADYQLTVKPRELTLRPDLLPVAFQKIGGELVLEQGRLLLRDVTGWCEGAVVGVSGWINPQTGQVNAAVAARNVKLVDPLRGALPAGVRRLLDQADVQGEISLDLKRLIVRPHADEEADLEFVGKLWLSDLSMKTAADVTAVRGVIDLNGAIEAKSLQSLSGSVDFDSLKLAGRPVRRLTARIGKAPDQDLLRITNIDGRIAGGTIAGQVDAIVSGRDPRFGLSLVLRSAKVSDLTGETDKPIDGRLNASLSLEGRWDDVKSRRGRGDVLVEGRNMYRVPVMLGFMQMANLTMPNDAPLRQAGVRYSVQGARVNLEAIDLRSADTTMAGNGWLDLESKKVAMTLMMSNAAADAVPIFGDLIRGARQDFLQIRVRGTLEEPKVGASTFNTLTTTIDEVLRGKSP